MSDVLLCAILVAFFVLAIALVRVLGRMIDRDADPDGLAADEPPDNSNNTTSEAVGEQIVG
jgi:hypothetical protein